MNKKSTKKFYIIIKLYYLIFIFTIIINGRDLPNKFNLIYKQKNKSKIVAISYSNNIYQTQIQFLKKSAFEIGKVDEFYDYGPQDVDFEFRKNNLDILSRKRGNGYWLWKPYFILKALNEKLNEGDYLIYTDATILYKKNAKILVDFLEKKNSDMWFYKQIWKDYEYSKRDAFILMGADNPYYTNTCTYNAAYQIYKKSKFSLKFVEDYLYYCKDKRIITDEPNVLSLKNYQGFKDHRHDQTILSLLIKKYNIANSGKTNLNLTIINNLPNEMPFIFCHYRRMNFTNYTDLKKKCSIDE